MQLGFVGRLLRNDGQSESRYTTVPKIVFWIEDRDPLCHSYLDYFL